MKNLPAKGFAEPAAFVARQVRRLGLRHFLFTSARKGEGTTTTVLGIARDLHQSYSLRVLAIEINPESNGFTTILEPGKPATKETSKASTPAKDIRVTTEGFTVLTLDQQIRGSGPNANLVDALGEMLGAIKDNFDVVLIDSPPVLDGPEVLTIAPQRRPHGA